MLLPQLHPVYRLNATFSLIQMIPDSQINIILDFKFIQNCFYKSFRKRVLCVHCTTHLNHRVSPQRLTPAAIDYLGMKTLLMANSMKNFHSLSLRRRHEMCLKRVGIMKIIKSEKKTCSPRRIFQLHQSFTRFLFVRI